MRNPTTALTVAMVALAGSPAVAAPRPPIALTLAWVGEPCNEQGRVVVTVTNTGDREIVMPIEGTMGIGGVFLGVARAGKAKPVQSDNWTPVPAPMGLDDVLPVRPVAPHQATRYRIDFDRRGDGTEEQTEVALDTAYQNVRQSGGEVWLVYALQRAPDPHQPFVLASGAPLMTNKLTCPA